ncbi:MAG TPA: FAD-dependent oxidoreductase [Gaiellaceae bacterium]|nr:FAD-dependent oxidoreductase [Gaiellaceae bacterium]
MRVAVVGGGLAGLAAALDLVDTGHEVTLYEARPTLGGKVQTLPERAGDPKPPPDNGQHIALGCFTEYLAFLERIGSAGQVKRLQLELTVIDERGRAARIGYGLGPLLSYRHLGLRDRIRIAMLLVRLPRLEAGEDETFGAFLRRHGQTDAAIERFWDVFIRPGLNLRTDEVQAKAAWFTVVTALRSGRAASDLVLPTAPLGEMHGDAARKALEQAGARVQTGVRVDDLDELAADAVVLALPPDDAVRLLGGVPTAVDYSPIVSVHLLFDRVILREPLAALLGSDAHWIFDRSALTGVAPSGKAPVRDSGPVEGVRGNREVPPWPPGAQYLTVVSSAAPELLEIRGRELVDRIAGQVTDRLGGAEVLWSRVSREPEATVAVRPGPALPASDRDWVALAGAWRAAPWPPTMESAVRSGRAAVRKLSDAATKVAVGRVARDADPKAAAPLPVQPSKPG